MRIIITGGTGLIGRALCAELVQAGYEVVVLSRSPSRNAGFLPEEVTVVGWDNQTGRDWAHLADGAEAIVNLAGESLAGKNFLNMRWTPQRKSEIVDSRVQSGAAVVDAVRLVEHKPHVVIQASGIDYYGPHGTERVTESDGVGEGFLSDICIDWEASTEPVESLGVRRAVIRLGIVLNKKGGALPQLMLPFRLFVGGPIGSGKQGYPWIHIEDVCRAIRFMIETPAVSGVFNLCSPQPVSNTELGRAIAHALHRPYWFPIPALVFKIAFGEAATLLLDGQMAYPQRLLDAGFDFRYPEINAALANI